MHPLLTIGLETKRNKDEFYWGPTISHGKNDLWFAIGYLRPGIKGSSADRKIRFIIGVELSLKYELKIMSNMDRETTKCR